MTERKGLRQRFQNYYDIVVKTWGGKHASELMPAEFKAANNGR